MLSVNIEKIAIKLYDRLRDRFETKPVPAPSDFYLGKSENLYRRDKIENVILPSHARKKHFLLIGGTGTGKTTFIEHCIRQEVLNDRGFCLLEPHGDLCENVVKFLASVWCQKNAKGKTDFAKRTAVVEPFEPSAIVPFNPLEISDDAQVYPCVLELMQIFKDKWEDMWGPRMAELLRATFVTLAEKRLSFLEAPALLTNTAFRNSMIERLQNEEVKNYFVHRYNRLREWDKIKYREPVLNKLTEFLTSENMRWTLAKQEKSFDFRTAIDQEKRIVLNLSKGRLKINSFLLGGLFLAKLQMAFISRTDIPPEQRKPFVLYLDEFQNFISKDEAGDLETLLSESRKYGLNLVMANQNLSQLNQKLLGAILGNIDILISFRLSRKDALVIGPEIDASAKDKVIDDLINLKVGQAYVKVKGEPGRLIKLPFPLPTEVRPEDVILFKERCNFFHAVSAQRIEREIQERHERLGINRNQAQRQRDENPGREENQQPAVNEEEGQNEW